MSDKIVFESVEDYINHQPEKIQKALKEIRSFILEAIQDAIELFNEQLTMVPDNPSVQ